MYWCKRNSEKILKLFFTLTLFLDCHENNTAEFQRYISYRWGPGDLVAKYNCLPNVIFWSLSLGKMRIWHYYKFEKEWAIVFVCRCKMISHFFVDQITQIKTNLQQMKFPDFCQPFCGKVTRLLDRLIFCKCMAYKFKALKLWLPTLNQCCDLDVKI